MTSDLLILGAVVVVSLSATVILASRDWRLAIASLVIQYLGVFILVNISWPVEMAAAKMLAGWMATAILSFAMASIPKEMREPEGSMKFGPFFRISAVGILTLAIASLITHSENWLPMIAIPVRWGSFMLIGIGLLQLSLTSHTLRVIIGLLTILSGFEIIYAAIESSTLVTGLLAGVNLGLALVGAYLLMAPSMEASR